MQVFSPSQPSLAGAAELIESLGASAVNSPADELASQRGSAEEAALVLLRDNRPVDVTAFGLTVADVAAAADEIARVSPIEVLSAVIYFDSARRVCPAAVSDFEIRLVLNALRGTSGLSNLRQGSGAAAETVHQARRRAARARDVDSASPGRRGYSSTPPASSRNLSGSATPPKKRITIRARPTVGRANRLRASAVPVSGDPSTAGADDDAEAVAARAEAYRARAAAQMGTGVAAKPGPARASGWSAASATGGRTNGSAWRRRKKKPRGSQSNSTSATADEGAPVAKPAPPPTNVAAGATYDDEFDFDDETLAELFPDDASGEGESWTKRASLMAALEAENEPETIGGNAPASVPPPAAAPALAPESIDPAVDSPPPPPPQSEVAESDVLASPHAHSLADTDATIDDASNLGKRLAEAGSADAVAAHPAKRQRTGLKPRERVARFSDPQVVAAVANTGGDVCDVIARLLPEAISDLRDAIRSLVDDGKLVRASDGKLSVAASLP